jgi:hypothetical protein
MEKIEQTNKYKLHRTEKKNQKSENLFIKSVGSKGEFGVGKQRERKLIARKF